MKKSIKRLSALLLTLCMLASLMVPVAFAENGEPETPAVSDELKVAENYPIRLIDPTKAAADVTDALALNFVADGAYASKVEMTEVYKKINKAYDDDTLNWGLVACTTIGDVQYRNGSAMQLESAAGDYVALKIKVQKPGVYSLVVSTDKTADYGNGLTVSGAYLNAFETSAYLIDASTLDLTTITKDTIADLATDENSVGVAAMAADATSATFNKTLLYAGEYVLIYTFTGTRAISGFSLVQSPEDVIQQTSGTVATYDFEIYKNERYIPAFGDQSTRSFKNSAVNGLEGAYEQGATFASIIANDYDAGIINFKLEDHGTMSDLTFRTNDRGLSIRKKETTEAAGAYAALRLNVPVSGFYTVTMEACQQTADPLDIYIYSADAEGTVLDNMTDDNHVGTFVKNNLDINFTSTLTAGEHIIVFKMGETTKKDTFDLLKMELKKTVNDPVNFNLFLTLEEYGEAFSAVSGGKVTTFAKNTKLNAKQTWTNDDGSEGVATAQGILATKFVSGEINWAQDWSNASSVEATGTNTRFRVPTTTQGYAGLRIRVESAGTYNVTVGAQAKTGTYNAYIIPAASAYVKPANCEDFTANMTEANLLGTSVGNNKPVTGTYTFDKAGEYILALSDNDNTNSDFYFMTFAMEPVSFVAFADGVAYSSLEAALENAEENVFLNEDLMVEDLVISEGVTLDLNGYRLYAKTLDIEAPAIQIVDATDGNGLLSVSSGNVAFNQNNAQLPLYDDDACGYRLFKTSVNSVTVTGSDAAPKYWFKLDINNKAALALIDSDTELEIKAQLIGDDFEAEAYADAAFSAAWATKYAANNGVYITVSVDNSEAVENLVLTPFITANGVIVSGEAMA